MNIQSNIYELEHEQLKHFKTPSDRIQHQLSYFFSKDNYVYEGKKSNRVKNQERNKKNKNDMQST